jgi:SAM-dependent methyltransferase
MSSPQFRSRPFARKFPFITPRCYVLGKVLTDPLYPAVLDVLRQTREPLLDVGCGMGVLAFYLRERGWQPPCVGVDVDAKKIALAQRLQHQWSGALEFRAADVTRGLPQHSGSVTLLDMLQYLPHDAQTDVLISAASRVSAEGVLVIRNAMSGAGSRAGITRITDTLAGWGRWMGTRPKDYPDRAQVCDTLAAQGLHGDFEPLWGHTPFHNWLGVFRRAMPR